MFPQALPPATLEKHLGHHDTHMTRICILNFELIFEEILILFSTVTTPF